MVSCVRRRGAVSRARWRLTSSRPTGSFPLASSGRVIPPPCYAPCSHTTLQEEATSILTPGAADRLVMLKTLRCRVRVVWVYRRTQWVALVSTDLDLSIEQIVEYYAARWKIEAGFREIKQEIGSAHTQTRNPDAVTNHLHFCMAATTITWIYAAHLNQAPIRRYASENTTEYAFADVRRSLAQHIAKEGFGIDCQDPGKPDHNPLISTVMRLVA